jgi:F0F1-type ATP synthase assembly protein I
VREQEEKEKTVQKSSNELASYLGMGLGMALTLLLGLGAGYWIDAMLGTKPAFLLVGAVVGMCLAGYEFYRALVKKP